MIRLKGVDQVEVDRRKNCAVIVLKDKADLTREEISKAFDNSKYKVTSFEKKELSRKAESPE